MIDTAKKYVGEKFHHIYQFDWTGRMYPVTANFHPQGNDIARGLHIFNKGAAINNMEQLNWLAIAGANHYGLNKESYEDRIKFAHSLGTDWAEDGVKQRNHFNFYNGVNSGVNFNYMVGVMYRIMFAVLMVQTMAINT